MNCCVPKEEEGWVTAMDWSILGNACPSPQCRLYKPEAALFKGALSPKLVLPPGSGKVNSYKHRQKQGAWFGNILDKSVFIIEGIYQRGDSGLVIYIF